jgi:rhodanese-related sulfurtransferase
MARLKLHRLIVMVLFFCAATVIAKTNEFPGRALYPEVSYIALSELQASLNDVVIVDVRSSYEFETLRVKGAINIPLSSKKFISEVQKIREGSVKPIIVYCNGKTCMKSYKAVRKCQLAKIDNVKAFDAGIMDWAKANPNNAELLGSTLKDPKKLISKDKFHKHLISPDEFGNRLAESNAIVLDVRDRFQREGISLFVGRERRVYLDDKKRLDRYINNAMTQGNTLLIYDAAGKQVRWLQYYLESKGVKDYYFMQGGIHQYYKSLQDNNRKSKKT